MRGTTLRQLRAFSQVAQHHSFARAAAELHLTPSAVSLQIKELEQVIGVSLFGRGGKAVSLTRAGDLLLADVRRALLALEDAEETLTRLRGRETGSVCIGMVSNAKYFVPRLLAQFHNEHPGIELRLSVGNREQLVRQMSSGDVNLVIMGAPPVGLDATAEPFAPQPLGVIAAPEHELAHARAIPVTALAGCEFIVREPGSGTRAAMERYFRDASIAPVRLMEVAGNETIKQAVIANMGIAFVSLHTAGMELQGRMLVALDVIGLPVMRRWYVVCPGGEPLAPAAEALRRFIIDHGGDLIARQFADLWRTEPAQWPHDALAA